MHWQTPPGCRLHGEEGVHSVHALKGSPQANHVSEPIATSRTVLRPYPYGRVGSCFSPTLVVARTFDKFTTDLVPC